jgi:hypothetical protein
MPLAGPICQKKRREKGEGRKREGKRGKGGREKGQRKGKSINRRE